MGYERWFIGRATYHVVRVDMGDPSVKVSPLLTARYPGGDEPASRIIHRYCPTAAVAGTYFCTVSLRPIGDIVIDGDLRHFGGMGTALAITPDNEVAFIDVPYGHHVDWAGFETVLAAGPRLVQDGSVSLSPRAQGFTDPHVLGRAARCAVGLTARNKLLLVATRDRVSLGELARAMCRLGCIDAINLDGGSSAMMYYQGRWVMRPRREMVDLLAVFEGVDRRRRVAMQPSGAGPSALARWRAEQAWTLFQKAEACRAPRRAVDFLTRACELDPANASYCVALGEALEAVGDNQAAASAYSRASSRYRAKGMPGRALQVARRAADLAPHAPHVILELARAGRAAGLTDAAREWMQRARSLFLLAWLPEAKLSVFQRAMSAVVSAVPGAAKPPRYVLAGAITGRTLASGQVGLYVHLPPEWEWLALASSCSAVAVRRYMPWLVSFAAAGVPESAPVSIIQREYLRNTMLTTSRPRPTRLGRAEAIRFTAQGLAGAEMARYEIVLAKRGTALVVISLAAEARWWEQAADEFEGLLQGVGFAGPPGS